MVSTKFTLYYRQSIKTEKSIFLYKISVNSDLKFKNQTNSEPNSFIFGYFKIKINRTKQSLKLRRTELNQKNENQTKPGTDKIFKHVLNFYIRKIGNKPYQELMGTRKIRTIILFPNIQNKQNTQNNQSILKFLPIFCQV